MREIKFKIWHKPTKQFVKQDIFYLDEPSSIGQLSVGLDGTLIQAGMYDDYSAVSDPEDYAIQQYTGLKDKNGVEIYEGDWVYRADGYTGVVEYCKVLHSNTGKAYVGFYLRKDKDNYTHIDGTLEVVGNIFEGPEGDATYY